LKLALVKEVKAVRDIEVLHFGRELLILASKRMEGF
jgi:hypothetical protein